MNSTKVKDWTLHKNIKKDIIAALALVIIVAVGLVVLAAGTDRGHGDAGNTG